MLASALGLTLSRGAGWTVGAVLTLGLSSGASAADPQGVWLTEERDAAVAIGPCTGDNDGLLCGRIIWLKDATGERGAPRLDTRNPNPALRARSICGVVVMDRLRPAGPSSWDGGSVYNPQDGRIYSGDMELLANSTLRVRAYLVVPFLGETQIWRRAERSAAGIMEYTCHSVRVPPAAR